MAELGTVELLTVHDVAKMAKVCGDSIRKYNRLGKLPAIRTRSGTRLFVLADVEKFLAERAEKAAEAAHAARTRE